MSVIYAPIMPDTRNKILTEQLYEITCQLVENRIMTRNIVIGKDSELAELRDQMAEMRKSHDEALTKAGDDEYDIVVENIQLKSERNQANDTAERQRYTIIALERQMLEKDVELKRLNNANKRLLEILGEVEKKYEAISAENSVW